MALSLKPELRTSQSLVMTPQLMQAIKLLQLSSIDLTAFVDAELERNPLLERDEIVEPADPSSDVRDSTISEERHEDEDLPNAEALPASHMADAPERLGEETSEADGDDAVPEPQVSMPEESWAAVPSRTPIRADDYNLEGFIPDRKSLADYLAEQLGQSAPNQAARMVGAALIAELDEAGYLRADPAELAARLGTSPELVNETLVLLKTFEPTGVFAQDLQECLALQLAEKDRLDPAMEALLANLDLVARREQSELCRRCAVDDSDVADMLEEIRALNPKPGADFDPPPIQTIIADILVTPAHDGGWKVELNSDTLPKLLINQTYYATVSKASLKETDRSFLTERFQTAKWLVDSLDRRARTILKVATEIVRQQDGFFAQGVEYLRPLNLKAVADAINMHESTVSRVTSNKYMTSSRGIFELKYFFTPAIQSADGGELHSAEAVRHRIRALIADEADAVLSDDAIVGLLRGSGIDIARRTVAKYRDAMRIPSSVNRRRERRAGG